MRHTLRPTLLSAAAAAFVFCATSSAQVTILSTFDPSSAGSLCSVAADPTNGDVWVFECFGANIQRYSSSGLFLSQVPRPGESANDVDIEVASEAMTLGSTALPAGTLLFINGESGVAEIYAVDKSSGAVLATLSTAFGVGHVVGGGYHPARDTFFLVQDKVPGGAQANLVAEINPLNGSVISTFQTSSFGFIVNYGDLDIATNGNLLLVSSDESTIAEISPAGLLVAEILLPSGVADLSGAGATNIPGDAWVAGSTGRVWRLGALPGCGLGCSILSYCAGDGSVAACPCANSGAPGHGCASSLFATGGLLAGGGSASISTDTLELLGSDMPNSSALYFQGTTAQGGGLGSSFGDGLRCAGGTVIRLGTKTNVANASRYPAPGDPSVSIRGAVSAPGVRTYQVWYRNAATFCTANTFNLTNGLSVTWGV